MIKSVTKKLLKMSIYGQGTLNYKNNNKKIVGFFNFYPKGEWGGAKIKQPQTKVKRRKAENHLFIYLFVFVKSLTTQERTRDSRPIRLKLDTSPLSQIDRPPNVSHPVIG